MGSPGVRFRIVTYRGWFRLGSIATLLLLVGFGAAASAAMGGIEQNDTPWAGAFERINAYAYFAWLVALAVVVLRRRFRDREETASPTH